MSKEYMNLRKEKSGKTGIIIQGASQLDSSSDEILFLQLYVLCSLVPFNSEVTCTRTRVTIEEQWFVWLAQRS
jgi:hypothetical protein